VIIWTASNRPRACSCTREGLSSNRGPNPRGCPSHSISITWENRTNDMDPAHRNTDGNTHADAHRIRDHVADFKVPPAGDELSEFECDSEGRRSNCGRDDKWSTLVHGRQESQHHIRSEM